MHDFRLADQDWIGFNFFGIRTGLGLKSFTVRSSLVNVSGKKGLEKGK